MMMVMVDNGETIVKLGGVPIHERVGVPCT